MKYITLFILFFSLVSNVSAQTQEPEVFIILMNEKGFDPSNITINKGDAIIFKNIDSGDRWPASNIHPTHSIYPEFDPRRPIPYMEEWRFTFDKTGNWKFHDHINPKFTGTITVNGAGSEKSRSILNIFIDIIKNLLASMGNLINRERINFEDKKINEITDNPELLNNYLEEEGIEMAMKRLIEESGGGSVYDCHQQAHEIGRVGYDIEGEDSFRHCSASCHSGCYHGAMESFLNKNGTTNIAENIKRICEKFETSFGNFECLHGVGHGVLAYLNYDLPEAIKECKNLGDPFSISACYGGLFMENILTGQGLGASENDHQTSWLKKDDPYFPCNDLGDDYDVQYQCYQMQTSWMLTITNYDFKKIADYCLKAPATMIPVCIKSYGRDAAGNSLRDPEKIMSLCKNISPGKRRDCVIGAVNVIIDFWGHDLKDQASVLCKLSEDDKAFCYDNLIGRLTGLFNKKTEILAVCDTMEISYANKCHSLYGN